MKKIFLTIIAFILNTACAQAALVSFSPSSNTVTLGQSFSMNIMGNFSTGETIEGGGLDLVFSPTVLSVSNVTINTALFDFFSIPGTINNSTGTVSGILFNTFAGANGNFLIATVDFTAKASGNSSLLLSQSALNPFSSSSAGASLNVAYQPASVTVTTVPIPAAIWLMLSGLGLMGFGVKKKK
ncbi:MAG: hypothetical protein HY081_06390 [Gammaproteobacteria bacterium]|nr:hypothetical protein [Gammaproteobacteria bacterium]